ncbi:MAG TPA: thiamine pyrophosphate-dependent enzyme [Candidatus Xenobia bacterium]|jgi:2-oxoisovalerate dehydrogenase E1 component
MLTRTPTETLSAFLALELPWLLPFKEEADLLTAVDQLSATDVRIYPGVTGADAVEWAKTQARWQIQGFFRRQALKGSMTDEERLGMYRTMVLSRCLDDRLKQLFMEKPLVWEGFPSPQKGFRALGQEAAVGLTLRLRRGAGGDLVSPLIRGLPILLAMMDDPLHVLLVQSGKLGTPVAGRDLHVGSLDHNVLPPTAPLGIPVQTMVGMAYAFKMRGENRVGLTVMGEGGTSHGDWHEAVNLAAVQHLNVIFVVENNHWALGTHWTEQTSAPRFALKAAGYGIKWVTVNGNDPDEVAAASLWATELCRSGQGPVLIETVTYRRSGHAHHDDDRFHGTGAVPGYEFPEERARWECEDPLELYRARLGLSAGDDHAIWSAARARVDEAVRAAAAAPWPEPRRTEDLVYAPRRVPVPTWAGARKLMSYDEAVRQALIEMMEHDPGVFVLGEDVGGRYGGAFGVTRGLSRQFGLLRCFNTPLAESAIVGCAVGAALLGLRPVVEMQFADFLASAFNALVNNAPKIHWRYGKNVPMVVRLPYGGATGTMNRLLGGGPYHSQCPEAWFARVPGWKIVAPATPEDAKGMMTAALRDENPVLFLEAKGLYGIFRPDLKEEVPLGVDFEVPFGQARVRRSGRDVTCVTYGAMLYVALEAADTLAAAGVDMEVIDLRTLIPLDEETVLASVRRTNRLLILHEDTHTGGFGAEVAARVAEKAVWHLDAPIVRVTAPDTPVPYSPPLEYAFLPKADDVVRAAQELVRS